MLPELLEHTLGVFMIEGYIILGVDSHVVHVDLKPPLQKHVCKDMVHESLESGGSIAEPQEHDGGFKESHVGNESSFPLVFLSDVNVVISPTNVKLGEQDGFLHVVNEFGDQGERVSILDGVGVQVVVILAGT